jgi:hypothetical protein
MILSGKKKALIKRLGKGKIGVNHSLIGLLPVTFFVPILHDVIHT